MRAATRNIIRKVWYGGWIFVASFLILLALAFSAIRLMLPLATDYKADIESTASRLLGQTVRIQGIDTDWRWFRPRLKLLGLRLEDADGAGLFSADEVILAMNPFSSMMSRRLEIDELTVVRTNFSLRRNEAGEILAQGFALPVPERSADAGAGPAVPEFLLERTLRVIDSEITFVDDASGTNYRLQAVNLAIRAGRQQHRVYLSVSLPGEIGERLEAGAELRGDPRNPRALRGRFFARASELELPAVLQKTAYRDSVSSGTLDFALWAELDNDAHGNIQGNINLRNFAGNFSDVPLLSGLKLPFDRIYSDLRARLSGDELELELENLMMALGGDAAPVSGLAIKTFVGGAGHPAAGEIMLDHFRLKDVWPVAAHYPPLREALDKAGVKGVDGDILQLYGRWNLNEDGRDIAFTTRFEELDIAGSGKTPSITALRGSARMLKDSIVVELGSTDSAFDYPRLFRDAIALRNVNGAVFARYADSSLTLAARNLFVQTPHVVSRHWFDLSFSSSAAPHADIYSVYEDGDVKAAGQYYPVGVMKENLVSWLDAAVLGGRLVAGDLELRGPLDRFPFRNNEGVFRIDTDFDGMELNYYKDWPHLREARLHTRFNAATLSIALHEGRILDTQLSGADVWITDFSRSWLVARAPLYGTLPGAADYLRLSGLSKGLGPLLDMVETSGMQAGLLRLEIPLHQGPDPVWSFASSIFDGALAFQDLGLDFSGIDGHIRFEGERIDAAPFGASLNGHPLQVEIGTYAAPEGNTARIALSGEVAPSDLILRLGSGPAGWFKGVGGLSAAIDLPLNRTLDTEADPAINLRLDATPLAIELPAPFAKEAGTPAVLSARSVFRNRAVLTDIDYADWLRGRMRFESGALERADIRLFEGRPKLPDTTGIFISGRVDELNIDRWLELSAGAGGAASPLQSLQLKARKLTYLRRSVNDASLQLTQQSQHWIAALESEFLAGSVAIPKPGGQDPQLIFDLKRFDFDNLFGAKASGNKDDVSQLAPGEVPPFTLRAERIVLNGWNLRQVELTARVDGQILNGDVKIADPDVGMEGRFEWSMDRKGAHHTDARLRFSSGNVGRGLGRFGYAEVIRDGEGTAKFDLSWPAAPHGFDLGLIRGEAEISIKDGQVLDIKPGGGRLFGLLSVQTIPRRLAFDFKDIFAEGFRFDRMRGAFEFGEGNAHTSNYYIEGPAGRIDIAGRVGMVQRDYDQRILFRPDLSSTLPIVGTLLGGTGTGIALIMVDRVARLFGKQTDDLARLEYTLTGSWDDPVMAPVRPPPRKGRNR